MSKSIIEIRRKRDGKILRDEINDACQTHNIYDGDVLVESNKDYNIGYFEGVGFCDFSEYEELADYGEQPMMTQEEKQLLLQEEKQLLLKDLCARLPYGVKGKVETTDGNGKEIKDEGVLNSVFINEHGAAYICIEGMEYELEDVKPYLRSSMTEEEKESMRAVNSIPSGAWPPCYDSKDWLNEHHFDYRGLIEKGLALEAPEGMYNI